MGLNLKLSAQENYKLRYHSSVQTGPIAGAIFSNPAIGDFDGDGTADLIVATKHHGAGVDFYHGYPWQNHQRLFAAPVRLPIPPSPLATIDWNRNGLTDLLVSRQTPHILLNQGGSPPQFSEPKPLSATRDATTSLSYEYLGVISTSTSHTIIASRNNFVDYYPEGNNHRTVNIGFWRGYDDSGRWRGIVKAATLDAWTQSGTNLQLTARPSITEDLNLTPFPTGASPIALDADRDGDQDLIIADFNGAFFYSPNIGTDASPRYPRSSPLTTHQGRPLLSPQCFVMGQGFDWNEDGWDDLIFGSEDSFIHVCLNQRDTSHRPTFAPAFKATCESPPLDLGVAACPWPCDLDRDGLTDLLVGNAAGEIWTLRGANHAEKSTFLRGELLHVNQEPFRLQAGPSGSIQGPAEATWGYLAPSTCDLDNDGDQDLLYSGITGYHYAMLNSGDKSSPRWSTPEPIQVNGSHLRTVWRTRPIVTHYDTDSLLDYVCLNAEGIVGHYRGADPENWNQFNHWTPWTFPDDQPIDADGPNGLEGRSKICLSDWDGDGRRDLLIGIKGDSPWAKDLERSKLTYIMFLKNLSEDPRPTFARPRPIQHQNHTPIELGDHTACPSVVALNGDTTPGLLVGGEDGRLYYFSQRELTW